MQRHGRNRAARRSAVSRRAVRTSRQTALCFWPIYRAERENSIRANTAEKTPPVEKKSPDSDCALIFVFFSFLLHNLLIVSFLISGGGYNKKKKRESHPLSKHFWVPTVAPLETLLAHKSWINTQHAWRERCTPTCFSFCFFCAFKHNFEQFHVEKKNKTVNSA